MTDINQGPQGSAFISYSRKDKSFVKKLNDALDNAGVQAWVDWEGIELASDWMQTITNAIQTHDAFIFVISPDSLKSKVCADELELGLKLNKKLIPVLYRAPEKRQKMHPALSKTNWVYMRQEDNFKQTLPKLIESIQTDLEWVGKHTQLLNQATEWENKEKNFSFLLQGTEVEEAEKWMADAADKENRNILPLQADFIRASRKAADRRQRFVLFGVSTALVVSIVLSILAIRATNTAKAAEAVAIDNQHAAATAQADAEINAQAAKDSQLVAENKTLQANADRSTAQAQILQTRSGELDSSTLVALEAFDLANTNNLNNAYQSENIIRINTSILAKPVSHAKQDGAIWNIEWSPDYQYFVAGNNHDPANTEAVNEACVYNGETGSMVYCVQHDDDVNDAIFSRDGQLLITASTDQTVKFWNASDGKLVQELQFDGAINDLDASDTVLAIAREDNFITFYYFNKPDLKPVSVEQAAGVKTVKFAPNGTFLAMGLQNGQIRFWHAKGDFFYNGPKHERSSYAVLAWSPDSNYLASGGGDSRAFLTKRDGTFRYAITHQDWVESVVFGPDPSWFVTVSDDNKLRVIETATGVEKTRMSHTHFAQKAVISSDGQWIASTGYDHVVRIWDSVAGSEMLQIPLDANGSALSFNKDHSKVVAADENGNISLWDISKLNSRIGFIAFSDFVREARYTPSGEFLIVNSDDFSIRRISADEVLTIADGTKADVITTTESLTYRTAISPDSKWVAAVERDTEDVAKNRGTLASIDGSTVFHLPHGGDISDIAFTHDSAYVATAGTDGLVAFWDVQTGERKFDLDNGSEAQSLAISPASSLAVVGLHDKIVIWDWSTRTQIQEVPYPGDTPVVAFSPDGSMIAAGSPEGTATILKYNGTSYAPAEDLIWLNGLPRRLAFSPDSKFLAIAGSSGFAYLIDTTSSREMARIYHSKNVVTSVSFSKDGTELITTSLKVVRIWDINSISLITRDELNTFACSHFLTNLSLEEWKIYFPDEEYRNTCPNLQQASE